MQDAFHQRLNIRLKKVSVKVMSLSCAIENIEKNNQKKNIYMKQEMIVLVGGKDRRNSLNSTMKVAMINPSSGRV